MLRDSPEYRRGRWGEIAWLAMLRRWGWTAIATCDYSGASGSFAPMTHGAIELVLPDYDVAKRGRRTFLESKLKLEAFPWRKSGRLQHGIETRLLGDYRRAEQVYGCVVVLGIVEEQIAQFRANTLRGLGEPRLSPDPTYPTSNWDRDKFRLIAEVDPARLHRLIYGCTRKGCRTRHDNDVRDAQQQKLTPQFLDRLADWLRPVQLELNLLHFDILAQHGALDD